MHISRINPTEQHAFSFSASFVAQDSIRIPHRYYYYAVELNATYRLNADNLSIAPTYVGKKADISPQCPTKNPRGKL